MDLEGRLRTVFSWSEKNEENHVTKEIQSLRTKKSTQHGETRSPPRGPAAHHHPPPVARGGRRLEIIADGLPLFGGAQLAVDTTLVSPLHCDGSARPGVAHTDGPVLALARWRKERTYPELIGMPYLVVLAGEIGGRSSETNTFAGVASHLTPVATTVQRARKPGCLVDVGGPWRVWQRGSVEKPEVV